MNTEKKKLFVGGLPDDVTEELMKKKFKIYGNITSVDIHRKKSLTDDTTNVFAFVTLNISQQNLNKCIYSNNDTTWKGKTLKISVAREYFLDRLVAERKENKIVKEWSQNPHVDNKNNYNKKTSVVIDDKNKNKVLKYADDDDDDDIEDEIEKQTAASSKKTKKDSNDDSDDDDDDSDDEEVTRRIKENNNKSEIVKVKAEKASKKRKASSDDDDDDDDIKHKKPKLETEEDMMAEKKKNLEILSSIVGKKPEKRKLPSSLNLQSTMMKRYDPSKPGHEEFEVEGQSEEEEDNSCEPTSKKAKKEDDDDDDDEDDSSSSSSSSSDNDDNVKKEITNKTSPTKNLLNDSKAFSEVSSSVIDAFKKTEAFKLSSLFGDDEDDEDEHGGDAAAAAGLPFAKRPKLMSDMFGWDKEESDGDDVDDDDVDRSDDEGKKVQKKKSKDDLTVSKKQKTKNKKSDVPSKFFFEINDPRLTEGNTFFRQDDIEELRKKWEDLRPQHVDSYRLRKKRYRMGKSKM